MRIRRAPRSIGSGRIAAELAVNVRVQRADDGAAVADDLVLQALAPRQAQLGTQMGGATTLTLDMALAKP